MSELAPFEGNSEPENIGLRAEPAVVREYTDMPIPNVHPGSPGERRIARRHRWGLAAVLLVVVGTAMAMNPQSGQDWIRAVRLRLAPKPLVEAPLPKATGVFALGRLEPLGKVASIANPEGGGNTRVQRLYVAEGDTVSKDAILATLDSESRLLAARTVAAGRVQQARVRLAQTRKVVASTRAELSESLQSAKASLALAKIRLNRRIRLSRSAALTPEELDLAQLEHETADRNVRKIEAQLMRYDCESHCEPPDVQVAQEELGLALAEEKEAEALLSQAYVRAPFAGTILNILARPGELMSKGTLLEMGATETMTARVEVYESDILKIRIGGSVRLSSVAVAGVLHGKVESVSGLVKKQAVVDADPAAHTDARVVEVTVRLDAESSRQTGRLTGLQIRAEFVE